MSGNIDDAPEKKRDQAKELFRKKLLDGTLRAGSTLTQQQLSDTLGISLTPLRELLVVLEDYSLVEVRQRSGITITYPDIGFIRDNLQFRAVLELSAIRDFVPIVDQAWIDDQTEIHETWLADLVSGAKGVGQDFSARTDRNFHFDIIKSFGNKTLEKTYQRIVDNVALAQLVHRRNYSVAQICQTVKEHLAIIEKIDDRDGEGAVSALQTHFRASTHRIIGV